MEKFAYTSITTDQWKEFLYSFFADKVALLDSVDWAAWLHGAGMPPVPPRLLYSTYACSYMAASMQLLPRLRMLLRTPGLRHQKAALLLAVRVRDGRLSHQ